MNNFLIEPYSLSSWARAKGLTHCFIYRGPSMIPTFHTGDFLYVRSTMQNLMAGDVVVFSAPDKANGYIVHRIVSNSDQGFITRGDHNRLNDVPEITLEKIVGKVEFVENKHGFHRVVNGAFGLGLAKILQWMFGLDRLIRRMFWTPYNFIREKRLAVMLWNPKISKMQVQSENTQQIKYLYKNRTVATWDAALGRFACRKPFDLVIPSPLDENPPS